MGLSTRKVRVERGPSAEPGLAGYFIEQLALGGTVAVGERMRQWIYLCKHLPLMDSKAFILSC